MRNWVMVGLLAFAGCGVRGETPTPGYLTEPLGRYVVRVHHPDIVRPQVASPEDSEYQTFEGQVLAIRVDVSWEGSSVDKFDRIKVTGSLGDQKLDPRFANGHLIVKGFHPVDAFVDIESGRTYSFFLPIEGFESLDPPVSVTIESEITGTTDTMYFATADLASGIKARK